MQVTDENIMTQIIDEIPTMTEALRYAVRTSGLSDKLVYLELGIDAGNWSRIMSGQSSFPHEKFIQLMKICRSEFPLAWLAKQCGYELKISQLSLEDQLIKEREEKKSLQLKLDLIVELLKRANIPMP